MRHLYTATISKAPRTQRREHIGLQRWYRSFSAGNSAPDSFEMKFRNCEPWRLNSPDLSPGATQLRMFFLSSCSGESCQLKVCLSLPRRFTYGCHDSAGCECSKGTLVDGREGDAGSSLGQQGGGELQHIYGRVGSVISGKGEAASNIYWSGEGGILLITAIN